MVLLVLWLNLWLASQLQARRNAEAGHQSLRGADRRCAVSSSMRAHAIARTACIVVVAPAFWLLVG